MLEANMSPLKSSFRSSAAFALLWTFAIPADAQSLSFLRPQYFPMVNNCCSVVTGDLNRDGRMDIAVAHGVSGVTVLLGIGNGGFTRIETGQGPAPGVLDSVIAAADFNSDGILDLLVTGYGSVPGYWSAVLLGNGDGTFRSPAVVQQDPRDYVIAVADFNADGKPDLLVHLGDGTGFAARLGNGDGTFQPLGPKSLYPQASITSAVVSDFNHDGKLDVAEVDIGGVYLWLGDGRGAVRTQPNPVQLNKSISWQIIAAGDFNRDGNLDLVIHDLRGFTVAFGNGDGTFQTGPFSNLPDLPLGRLTAADVNGDGIPDVISGSTVLLGNGDGSLQAPVAVSQWGVLATADLNGDGKPDLLAGANGGLSVLINNAPGPDSSAAAVSAATLGSPVAPGSIASVFGKGLAATTASASGTTWPTSLENVRVLVLDAFGVERPAGILYVSPTQVNFQIPPDTATGYAVVNVDSGKTPFIAGARLTLVDTLAAGFFTADGTGTGVAAATAMRLQDDDTRIPVPVVQCASSGSCTPVPIDLSLDGTVYLSLYGTGFGPANIVDCGIPVTYSGPQKEFPGLDQLNVVLPQTLPHGKVDISCYFTLAVRRGSTAAGLEVLPSPRAGDFSFYSSTAVFTIYLK